MMIVKQLVAVVTVGLLGYPKGVFAVGYPA